MHYILAFRRQVAAYLDLLGEGIHYVLFSVANVVRRIKSVWLIRWETSSALALLMVWDQLTSG